MKDASREEIEANVVRKISRRYVNESRVPNQSFASPSDGTHDHCQHFPTPISLKNQLTIKLTFCIEMAQSLLVRVPSKEGSFLPNRSQITEHVFYLTFDKLTISFPKTVQTRTIL